MNDIDEKKAPRPHTKTLREEREEREEARSKHMTQEEMEARKRETALKKLKSLVANKDIYEFSDEEKELYISHHPEQFSHVEEDLGTAEFISSSPVAEAVLSDFFTKKERTKGMDFLFNFHTGAKCNS